MNAIAKLLFISVKAINTLSYANLAFFLVSRNTRLNKKGQIEKNAIS